MPKYFVLDTNVLLYDDDSISSFADNTVVLPMAVIEELDRFKKDSDELGRNARSVSRKIDALREKGKLGEGVLMENGGILKIVTGNWQIEDGIMDISVVDNKILGVAYNLHKQGNTVIFVSKDINARLKADALGITAMDFEKQKINFERGGFMGSIDKIIGEVKGLSDRVMGESKGLFHETKELVGKHGILIVLVIVVIFLYQRRGK